jgi:pimeloyl-ACP methyl ester carboxylesterase
MKTLVILHGWSVRSEKLNIEKWTPFIDYLKSKKINVIFLAIPGISTVLNEVWELSDFSNWLEKEVEGLSLKGEVYLLGHSFGGQLSVRYLAEKKNKIDGLVLLDSSGIRDMAFKKVVKRNIFLVLAKIGKVFVSSEFLKSVLYKIARESDYKNASPYLKKTMSNILADQILDDLPKVSTPTKIIWGELDLITPIKHAHKINQLIEKSSISIVDGARHSPQFTHPTETAKLVYEFIK